MKYIGFGLVWFYGISTSIGYLMLNPLYILLWSSDKTGGRTTQKTGDRWTLLY